MNKKTLAVALAASLALNVFAVAAGVTVHLNRSAAQEKVEKWRSERDRPSLMQLIDDLDPARRESVRAALRQAALAARPDFQESRDARRQAISLAQAEVFDATAVSALLEQSRASELRGRARLEADAVRILSDLNPQDRAGMSAILMRHGPRHGRRGGTRADTSGAPGSDEASNVRPVEAE